MQSLQDFALLQTTHLVSLAELFELAGGLGVVGVLVRVARLRKLEVRPADLVVCTAHVLCDGDACLPFALHRQAYTQQHLSRRAH